MNEEGRSRSDRPEREPPKPPQPKPVKQAPNELPALGWLAAKYGSGSRLDDIGRDSTGGYSYGLYQIATETETMKEFIAFSKERSPAIHQRLIDAGGPNAAAKGSEQFQAAWKKIAKEDPKGFADVQREFITRRFYEPQATRLRNTLGIDLSNRSGALREVVFSTVVQHGPRTDIFNTALAGKNITSLSDAEIIRAVYAERAKRFPSSTPNVRESVKKRLASEEQDALGIPDAGLKPTPVPKAPAPKAPAPKAPAPKAPAPKAPAPKAPVPKAPAPKAPAPKAPAPKAPAPRPPAPRPPGPRPPAPRPSPKRTTRSSLIDQRAEMDASAVAMKPDFVRAQFVVENKFLSSAKVDEIIHYTLAHELDFGISEVVSSAGAWVIDVTYRRSRVLMDIGKHEKVIVTHMKAILPRVLKSLQHRVFHISRVDVQITASNHGDFFRIHSDVDEDELASREITFVYFLHSKPKAFRGGELRIYDSRLEGAEYVSTGTYSTVTPKHNQVVFFPSSLMHEVMPVNCPSQSFVDSRFTVNGWICRN